MKSFRTFFEMARPEIRIGKPSQNIRGETFDSLIKKVNDKYEELLAIRNKCKELEAKGNKRTTQENSLYGKLEWEQQDIQAEYFRLSGLLDKLKKKLNP